MQPSPENNAAAGEYILPTSNSEYLTEETLISKGLTKEQLGLARNEILPDMEGCLIRQKYSSILIPDPGMFQSMRRQSLTQWETVFLTNMKNTIWSPLRLLRTSLADGSADGSACGYARCLQQSGQNAV